MLKICLALGALAAPDPAVGGGGGGNGGGGGGGFHSPKPPPGTFVPKPKAAIAPSLLPLVQL